MSTSRTLFRVAALFAAATRKRVRGVDMRVAPVV